MNAPLIHVKHLHLHLPTPAVGPIDLGALDLSKASNAAAASRPRFELSPDGSYVTDHKTGIQWATETTDYMSYDKGMAYCAALTLGGLTGWTIGPLERRETITDRTRFKPAMPMPFKGDKYEWTCTPYLPSGNDENGQPRAFWQVYGSYGGVYYDGRDDGSGVVRPCRLVPRPGQ
ncbi:hypothetical protein [Rhodanobacter hydrolyticus]|uniref:DUF1566 domain-containing protein n=1 Tax=Rhodanobacter hydrolyticus TaxID=2250595 RepID=A0ABW8J3S4_9GAMM